MNRTLTKKLIYVIAAITLLAMMIPAMAIPASAAGETVKMYVAGTDGQYTVLDGDGSEAYNAYGTVVKVVATPGINGAVISWALNPGYTVPGYQAAGWYNGVAPLPTATEAYIQGFNGDVAVTVSFAGGASITVHKKWGLMTHTVIGTPNSTYVTWNEGSKSFYATGNVTDLVMGVFEYGSGPDYRPVQGAVLNWYIVAASATIPGPGYPWDLNPAMMTLATTAPTAAKYTEFVNPALPSPWDNTTAHWLGPYVQTITGADGKSNVNIGAWFEETVKIVVIPEYPSDLPNTAVVPEVTTFSFATYEYPPVPQVRWAGEKIVLEADFGHGSDIRGAEVQFYLENQSVGTLEGITDDEGLQDTVWTGLDENGIASCILTSSIAGESNVRAALYPRGRNEGQSNQQSFTVYFLNFYTLKLTDVYGKRAGHNYGDWVPANPWNNNFPAGIKGDTDPGAVDSSDILRQIANVSQDTLERVQVRGWFMRNGYVDSGRPAAFVDLNGNGVDDIAVDDHVKAGYYVLPDDWPALITDTKYAYQWDIMDEPGDTVTAKDPLGPYTKGTTTVAEYPTVGPFSPALEVMTPTGWMVENPIIDKMRVINTVVPNGAINAWDAPMPPAKIVFEIMSGPGYFKEALKTTVYYTGTDSSKVYTAPFYQALIPAHWAIPPFNNDGSGYDWDSFDGVHGNYCFWNILNQPYYGSYTVGDATHPTRVEVYSDNHGEAMAYLNGDYNLDLNPTFKTNGAADILPGAKVGETVVRASALYPYVHYTRSIISNTVVKEWTWGGMVLGPDATHIYAPQGLNQTYTAGVSRMVIATGELQPIGLWAGSAPNQLAASSKKCVFVWVTDRDGLVTGVLGDTVLWTVAPKLGSYAEIATSYGVFMGINSYNEITENIGMQFGFLAGTEGVATDAHNGYSKLISPKNSVTLTEGPYTGKTALQALFYKFYNTSMDPAGLQPNNFAVAMIEVENMGGTSYTSGDFNVNIKIVSDDFGLTDINDSDPSYGRVSRRDIGTVSYNTNCSFSQQDPLDDAPVYGDANADGVVNMGDVTTIERMILGLQQANVNADPNITNSVDMGDVVKLERMILGY